MNHELAKQLKETGFPQQDMGARINSAYRNLPAEGGKITDDFYYPTLEELIEACGDKFLSLERLRSPDEDGSFWASGIDHARVGMTGVEAVAHLWLALNKK